MNESKPQETRVPTHRPKHSKRIFPFQVFLPAAETGLEHDSKAQAELVRSVDLERFVNQVGVIDTELLAQVDEALRLHLDL